MERDNWKYKLSQRTKKSINKRRLRNRFQEIKYKDIEIKYKKITILIKKKYKNYCKLAKRLLEVAKLIPKFFKYKQVITQI